MNVAETIQKKVYHLPPDAQQEVLKIVEEIGNRYRTNEEKQMAHPLDLLAEIQIDAPPDFAEKHDFYAHGKLEE